MDKAYFKSDFLTAHNEYEDDIFGRDVVTSQSVVGDVVVVRVRQCLDLTAYFTFMIAAEKANKNPRTELVLVDLGLTKLYFESGAVMLQLLRDQLRDQMKDRIFLINASPDIKQRLELELPPEQFHLGVTRESMSSVTVH